MKTNPSTPLSRWTCVRLHLSARIDVNHPLRSIAFHLYGVVRQFAPHRGIGH